MGRTSSKINKKFVELLENNTLPKCAGSSIKRIRKVLMEDKTREAQNVFTKEKNSDSESVVTNISDRLCINDSGFSDSAISQFDDSFSRPVKNVEHSIDGILPLRPLYFEVPVTEKLMRRMEVLENMDEQLLENRGVVLSGKSGTGKTSIILDLVQRSFFGVQPDCSIFSSSVVGYHFLTQDDPKTLDLARFIHSLAAQLSQHPALKAYMDLLRTDINLQSMLTMSSLRQNPQVGFEQGVLDPLRSLFRQDKISLERALILIDGLDNENQDLIKINSISDFLNINILRFPAWLKLVVSHRNNRADLTYLMHLPYIDLLMEQNLGLQNDLQVFIETKIFSSESILSNITHSNPRKTNMLLAKIVQFILTHAQGSFLYAELILELIKNGNLTLRSESLSQVPRNLDEAFHLILSIRFPCSVFYRSIVSNILSVVLSSPKPISLPQVYAILETDISFQTVKDEYSKIKDLLITRSDGTLMFLSHELKVWLLKEHRFNIKPGHNLFIKHLYTQNIHGSSSVLEFVYHLAECDLFNQDCDFLSNFDRKYLFLKFKVDRDDLKKARKKIKFSGYSGHESLSLLNLVLGSNVNID